MDLNVGTKTLHHSVKLSIIVGFSALVWVLFFIFILIPNLCYILRAHVHVSACLSACLSVHVFTTTRKLCKHMSVPVHFGPFHYTGML